jgi:hypothetical protein
MRQPQDESARKLPLRPGLAAPSLTIKSLKNLAGPTTANRLAIIRGHRESDVVLLRDSEK